MAADCIKGTGALRNITRDEHEVHREATNERMATPEGKAIYKKRAPCIEGMFGVIKSCLGIRRFTLRGLPNVRSEWTWICAAYNLKKLLALEANTTSRPRGMDPRSGMVPQACRNTPLLAAAGAYFAQIIRHHILQARYTSWHGLQMKKMAIG